MKALLLVEPKRLEIVDMPLPVVGTGDLLVRIKACGICGSDVHGYDGSTGRRIPPIVMGHEAAGIVESIGRNVRDFSVGDRITFDSTVSCGDCYFCGAGRINLCDNRRVLGVSCAEYRQHGCFAEYAAIPARIAYKLPDALSFEHAAMVEAVSIAVHAINRAGQVANRSAVIVGAGMIGQLVIQALRASDCTTLIALDIDERRRAQAGISGAAHVLDAAAPDVLELIRSVTAGRGADLAFEAVGAAASVDTAIAAVRKGGTVVLIGNTSPHVPLPLQTVVTRELSLLGTCASAGEYPACLDLLALGAIRVDPLLSAVAPLEEGPAYFARLHRRDPDLVKVILRP